MRRQARSCQGCWHVDPYAEPMLTFEISSQSVASTSATLLTHKIIPSFCRVLLPRDALMLFQSFFPPFSDEKAKRSLSYCRQRRKSENTNIGLEKPVKVKALQLVPVKIKRAVLPCRERKRGAARGRAEEGLEGVMLQRGARGAVRLGKEVCVHIPSLPAAGERGGIEREGKEGETSGKMVGGKQRRHAPGTIQTSISLRC